MLWPAILFLAFDLASARQEPNLDKRSDLALKNADAALNAARDAYAAADMPKAKEALDEARQSVDLSYDSLNATGKNPRGAGSYKRAEMALGQILRRLEGMRQLWSAVDRDVLDPAQSHVREVHERVIQEIMGKKKR